MNRAAWIAATTLPMTTGRGAELAGVALADAQDVVRRVAGQYHGMTPPPPWPSPPELIQAAAALRKTEAALEVLARARPTGKLSDRAAGLLRAQGDVVYREAAALETRAAAIPRAADLIPAGLTTLALWAGGVWLLSNLDS
jgi:hypothetical protein